MTDTVDAPKKAGALESALKRYGFTLAAAGIAYLLGGLFHLNGIQNSSQYFYGATILLTIGLFGSTSQISVAALRSNIRIILTAVTAGVLLKALLIAAFMYLIYRDPAYFVLGVAVAQIDPLSVAAMQRSSRLSDNGNAILLAWSSFDDPVTMLLTIYLSSFALSRMGVGAGLPSDGVFGGGLLSFGGSLLVNVAFVGFALLLWLGIVAVNRRVLHLRLGNSRVLNWVTPDVSLTPAVNALAIVVLLALAVLTVMNFLMLGLAIAGLFFRPLLKAVLGWGTRAAFLAAAVGLGLVLTNGFHLVAGLLLGGVAFLAQVLVGLLVTRSLPKADRGYLAFSQQNGITAIILALLLEPVFPQTAGIVAPAILTVNLLHGVCTFLWSRSLDHNRHPKADGSHNDVIQQPLVVPALVQHDSVRSQKEALPSHAQERVEDRT